MLKIGDKVIAIKECKMAEVVLKKGKIYELINIEQERISQYCVIDEEGDGHWFSSDYLTPYILPALIEGEVV